MDASEERTISCLCRESKQEEWLENDFIMYYTFWFFILNPNKNMPDVTGNCGVIQTLSGNASCHSVHDLSRLLLPKNLKFKI